MAYLRLTVTQRIALGPKALTVPASRWSADETEIAYAAIAGLSEAKLNGQRFLHIDHIGGRFTLTASLLPSKAAFDEVRDAITAEVLACQSKPAAERML